MQTIKKWKGWIHCFKSTPGKNFSVHRGISLDAFISSLHPHFTCRIERVFHLETHSQCQPFKLVSQEGNIFKGTGSLQRTTLFGKNWLEEHKIHRIAFQGWLVLLFEGLCGRLVKVESSFRDWSSLWTQALLSITGKLGHTQVLPGWVWSLWATLSLENPFFLSGMISF